MKVFLLIVLIAVCAGGIFLLRPENFFGVEADNTRSDDVTSRVTEENDSEMTGEVIPVEPEPVYALLPETHLISDVPFTVQAPMGQWQNPIFQDACEEASIIMAVAWVRGDRLTADGVTDTIGILASWQKKVFGHAVDTSIADTARMLKEYYGMTGAVQTEVTIEDIKRALASDQLVIVPTDGRKLKNPNFTQPGPPRHMLVVLGYDDAAGEFIVNDPGTRKGAGYRYGQDILYDAILDYPTGNHLPVSSTDKVMLVVGKE